VGAFSYGVLVAGIYRDQIGSGGTGILSGPTNSVFAARIHASEGNWIVNVGDEDQAGASTRSVIAAAVDGADHPVIVGTFTNDMAFPGGPTLTSEGIDDVYVVKLDATGGLVFAKGFGSSGKDEVFSVAIDETDGAIYVAGAFANDFVVDGLPLDARGGTDGFLLKVDGADGTALWAKTMLGTGAQRARKVATDGAGNVYVAGRFDGQLEAPSRVYDGIDDGFVWSFSRSGDWCGGFVLAGGPDNVLVGGLDVDDDELMIAASFDGTITTGTTPHSTAGESDVVVVSYDLP
jgi:hypothetical protein